MLPALVLLSLLACRDKSEDDSTKADGAAAPGLDEQAQPSLQALAAVVLRALLERDAGALERLHVTRAEYLELLGPQLAEDSAEDAREGDAQSRWLALDARSRTGIAGALRDFGGRSFELIDVASDAPKDYGAFRITRRVRLQVRRADGEAGRLEFVNAVIEVGGRYKVLGYRE